MNHDQSASTNRADRARFNVTGTRTGSAGRTVDEARRRFLRSARAAYPNRRGFPNQGRPWVAPGKTMPPSAATRRQYYSRPGIALPRIDMRKPATRCFRDLINAFEADLGGGEARANKRTRLREPAGRERNGARNASAPLDFAWEGRNFASTQVLFQKRQCDCSKRAPRRSRHAKSRSPDLSVLKACDLHRGLDRVGVVCLAIGALGNGRARDRSPEPGMPHAKAIRKPFPQSREVARKRIWPSMHPMINNGVRSCPKREAWFPAA
jgi:hypothetical protein